MEKDPNAGYEREPRKTWFKPYWKTLRTNRTHGSWFHRGAVVAAIVTTRCNLHCDYCPMFMAGDGKKYPKFEESTLEEWKTLFKNFPEHISQVYITGGEPSILPWMPDLVNWLIEDGKHVTLFTNLLQPANILKIRDHWRFIIIPTFHKWDDEARYREAYRSLEPHFRLISQEFGSKRFSFSRKKNQFSVDWFMNHNTLFHFAPDSPRTRNIYLGCVPAYTDGFKVSGS